MANTPGYNSRIAIFHTIDKHGKRRYHIWSMRQIRSFPIAKADAERFLAADQAENLGLGHPFRPGGGMEGGPAPRLLAGGPFRLRRNIPGVTTGDPGWTIPGVSGSLTSRNPRPRYAAR